MWPFVEGGYAVVEAKPRSLPRLVGSVFEPSLKLPFRGRSVKAEPVATLGRAQKCVREWLCRGMLSEGGKPLANLRSRNREWLGGPRFSRGVDRNDTHSPWLLTPLNCRVSGPGRSPGQPVFQERRAIQWPCPFFKPTAEENRGEKELTISRSARLVDS